MQHIPPRAHAFVSALSGIVVTETIDNRVPNGSKLRDQQRLPQWYPNIVHHEKTTEKILDVEVIDIPNTIGMFRLSIVKILASGNIEASAPTKNRLKLISAGANLRGWQVRNHQSN